MPLELGLAMSRTLLANREEDLDTLFVTTAPLHAREGERHAGGLFEIPVDVKGLPTERFRLS